MNTQIKLRILKDRLGTTVLLDAILDTLEPEELEPIIKKICDLWDYKDLIKDNN